MTFAAIIREMQEQPNQEPCESPLVEWTQAEIEDTAASLGIYA